MSENDREPREPRRRQPRRRPASNESELSGDAEPEDGIRRTLGLGGGQRTADEGEEAKPRRPRRRRTESSDNATEDAAPSHSEDDGAAAAG